MSYDHSEFATATSELKTKTGAVPVYKRVLALFKAEASRWTVVSLHHEAAAGSEQNNRS